MRQSAPHDAVVSGLQMRLSRSAWPTTWTRRLKNMSSAGNAHLCVCVCVYRAKKTLKYQQQQDRLANL